MSKEASKEIKALQQMIDESSKIVFFGGAGVSTESGIPDFRSVDGLYNQKYDYPPETILSHTFYMKKPEEFFRFYRDKMLCLDKNPQPNAAHKVLAKLEATDCIRRQAAKRCLSFTAACCAITVKHAIRHMAWRRL